MFDELQVIDKCKLVGLILDMSTRFIGRLRLVDEVKAVLTNVFTSMNIGDLVYLFTNATNDCLPGQLSEGISKMADFEIPFNFNFNIVAAHTIDVIGNEEADEKYMLVVTDRYEPKKQSGYERILKDNIKNKYGCKTAVISIGGRFAKELDVFKVKYPYLNVHHLKSIAGFEHIVRQFLSIGEINGEVYKESAEQSFEKRVEAFTNASEEETSSKTSSETTHGEQGQEDLSFNNSFESILPSES